MMTESYNDGLIYFYSKVHRSSTCTCQCLLSWVMQHVYNGQQRNQNSHVLVGDDVGFPVDRRRLLLADLLIPVASPLRLLCHATELEHHPHSQHHRSRAVGHAYQSPGHRRRPLVGRLSRGVRSARLLPLLLLRLLRLHHLTENSSSIGVFIA